MPTLLEILGLSRIPDVYLVLGAAILIFVAVFVCNHVVYRKWKEKKKKE